MKNIFLVGVIILVVAVASVIVLRSRDVETVQAPVVAERSSDDMQSSTNRANVQSVPVSVENSRVMWRGKAVGKEHKGSIKIKEGTINMANNAIVGGDIVIDMDTITDDDLSGEMQEKLVTHLKSDDFFSVATHPEAFLAFTGDPQNENGDVVTMTGDLTIKGITHSITFDAKKTIKDGIPMITADVSIDRTLWDVQFGSEKFIQQAGVQVIDDMIDLQMTIAGQ